MANSNSTDPLDETLGPLVPGGPSPAFITEILQGKYVTLARLKQADLQDLWQNLDPANNQALFNYLPLPPGFAEDPHSLWATLHALETQRDFVIYAIKADRTRLGPRSPTSDDLSDSTPNDPSTPSKHSETIGVIAYLDIQPAHRSVEIGVVVFSPILQRTVAATEAHYLMLRHAFGADSHALSPCYRRVVWKCHIRNKASRRAADRLGFVYEGTWRNHMVVNGRSRDSDFLSMVAGEEWEAARRGLERWLSDENFDDRGRQIRDLDSCREMEKVKP